MNLTMCKSWINEVIISMKWMCKFGFSNTEWINTSEKTLMQMSIFQSWKHESINASTVNQCKHHLLVIACVIHESITTDSLNEYLNMHFYANANVWRVNECNYHCSFCVWLIYHTLYTVVHVTVCVKINTFNIFSLYHCTLCIQFSISFCNEIFTVWRHYDVIMTSS